MKLLIIPILGILFLIGCIGEQTLESNESYQSDINETIDSDNDGYLDNVDDFPSDPTKHTRKFIINVDSLPQDVDSSYINTVKEAMRYWSDKEGFSFKEGNESITNYGYVDLIWVNQYKDNIIGSWNGQKQQFSTITIGLGDSYCLRRWSLYTYDTILHIVKHEFGHLLGYDHSENSTDLMYNFTLTKYILDFNESDVLSPHYLIFYPVCSKREFANYTFTIQSFYNLNIYVVPSYSDYYAMANYYTIYPPHEYDNCRGWDVNKYQRTCFMNTSGGIILDNDHSEINVKYNITAKEQ